MGSINIHTPSQKTKEQRQSTSYKHTHTHTHNTQYKSIFANMVEFEKQRP